MVVGFDAVTIQCLQLAFVNGQPDIGVITPDETVEMCRKIRNAINLPIIVDLEQGFGGLRLGGGSTSPR